eukprot:TRINITY_DN82096_c0_g1_i1.p2 TRINITY_DN82096_c0_g1~~TRINITY_DN82096_c0_g1_i1.p2  ORF type:complete len:183 (+),score=29.85 TRINITY_DN82096_c0_g1_i1:71-619(+)
MMGPSNFMPRLQRRAVYSGDYIGSSCPLEATIAEAIHELLPPPPQLLERHVAAVGVRDLAKLKQMRAAGCEKCSAYKSIRACGHCLKRPRERHARKEPVEATESFCARSDRSIVHEGPEARGMPSSVPSAEVRPPTYPKACDDAPAQRQQAEQGVRPPRIPRPATGRPRSVSRLSKECVLQA